MCLLDLLRVGRSDVLASLHVQILCKSVIREECNTDALYYTDLFVLSSQFLNHSRAFGAGLSI